MLKFKNNYLFFSILFLFITYGTDDNIISENLPDNLSDKQEAINQIEMPIDELKTKENTSAEDISLPETKDQKIKESKEDIAPSELTIENQENKKEVDLKINIEDYIKEQLEIFYNSKTKDSLLDSFKLIIEEKIKIINEKISFFTLILYNFLKKNIENTESLFSFLFEKYKNKPKTLDRNYKDLLIWEDLFDFFYEKEIESIKSLINEKKNDIDLLNYLFKDFEIVFDDDLINQYPGYKEAYDIFIKKLEIKKTEKIEPESVKKDSETTTGIFDKKKETINKKKEIIDKKKEIGKHDVKIVKKMEQEINNILKKDYKKYNPIELEKEQEIKKQFFELELVLEKSDLPEQEIPYSNSLEKIINITYNDFQNNKSFIDTLKNNTERMILISNKNMLEIELTKLILHFLLFKKKVYSLFQTNEPIEINDIVIHYNLFILNSILALKSQNLSGPNLINYFYNNLNKGLLKLKEEMNTLFLQKNYKHINKAFDAIENKIKKMKEIKK